MSNPFPSLPRCDPCPLFMPSVSPWYLLHTANAKPNCVIGFLKRSALHQLLKVRSIRNQVSQYQSGLWLLPKICLAHDSPTTSMWNVAAYKTPAVDFNARSPEAQIQKWNCTLLDNRKVYFCELLNHSLLNELIPYPMLPNVYQMNVSIPFQEGDVLGIYQPLAAITDTQLYFVSPESNVGPCNYWVPATDDQYQSALTRLRSFNISVQVTKCQKGLPLVNTEALQGNQS